MDDENKKKLDAMINVAVKYAPADPATKAAVVAANEARKGIQKKRDAVKAQDEADADPYNESKQENADIAKEEDEHTDTVNNIKNAVVDASVPPPVLQVNNASDDKNEDAKKLLKDVGRAGSAIHGLHTASRAFSLYRLLAMMRAFANAVKSFAVGIATNIANTVVGFVSSIAVAFGLPAVASIAIVASLGGAVVAAIAAIIASIVSFLAGGTSTLAPNTDCLTGMDSVSDALTAEQISAQEIQNAQAVYSVLKQYGLSDTCIAGVLGNWSCESGIDPTGVETIYDEKYTIGPKKLAAQNAGFLMKDINPSYSGKYPNIVRCGLGLGQWTDTKDADRHTRLLNFASTRGLQWYDLSTQLAFMLTDSANGGDSGSVTIAKWKENLSTSVNSATEWFCRNWEGISCTTERKERAGYWATMIPTWTLDIDYADSIISMATEVSSNATGTASSNLVTVCEAGTLEVVDNGSIASAAVSYAYENISFGRGNNGTPLYQKVHDAVFNGDTVYQSCDRSVATAVRWSGADDNYPAGGVSVQLSYVISSKKWKEVAWGGDMANLEPGDVLLCTTGDTSHTVVYVGTDAIRAKYPNAPDTYAKDNPDEYAFVSGSLNERSPGCEAWNASFQKYRVFRCVEKETAGKYVNAATFDASIQ